MSDHALPPHPPAKPSRTRLRLLALALAMALLPPAPAAAQKTRPAAQIARSQPALPPPVLAAMQQADLPPDAMAVALLPVAARWPTWLRQADRPMQPASTMKLVTSVVALDRLGPNHRGFTELRSAAPLEGDVLRGDLVLRGGADPELGLPQLWALLLELRHQGLREIAGDIVLDRHLFHPARTDIGLPPFDEQPEFPYNVIPDALHLNGSLMTVELSSPGGRIAATLLPPLPGIVLDTSAMTTSTRPCKDWDEDWISPPQVSQADGVIRIGLRGGFPPDCTQRQALQLMDRDLQAEAQLRWLWRQLGGSWSGRLRAADGPTLATTRLLARREARPWGELLRQLNKTSDNAYARLLFLSLGLKEVAAQTEKAGQAQISTAELAAREVRQWMAEQHIDTSGLVLDNGSGLSRSERITPRQMALLLKAAYLGRQQPELLMSLPVAGVDGSLRNRLKDGPATGSARLKPGTLRNVVALAGYVTDPQGRLWALAAMINHEQAIKGRTALDALVNWVAAGGVRAAGRSPVGPRGEGP